MITITLTAEEASAIQIAIQWDRDPHLKSAAAKIVAARTGGARTAADPHTERMLDGGDATFGRTDDGYEDPRDYA